jgi:hypothetical protein
VHQEQWALGSDNIFSMSIYIQYSMPYVFQEFLEMMKKKSSESDQTEVGLKK